MPSFATPFWLLLAFPVLFFLWKIHRQSFTDASRARRFAWLVLRSILALTLIIVTAGLQLETTVRRSQILFLLDVSDSIAPDQREKALEWINRAIRKIKEPDQAGLVVFGADAAVEHFPGHPAVQQTIEAQVDPSATNLEAAANLASAVFAENYQKSIVILSDGNDNAGRPENLFAWLKQKGISFQAHYVEPSLRPEAATESVRTPARVSPKQAFQLEAVLSANRNMPALLQIYRNGILLQEREVSLHADKKELIRLPQTINEPGLYRYQVQLKPKEDFRNENNQQEVWVSVEGPSRILLVDENPGELTNLAAVLRRRGFQIDLKSARDFPLSLQEMLLYQAIFIRNIPASQIHSRMEDLKRYVKDLGGGFAMIGGKQSFGPGGYYKTPVEEVLPVTMDLENKKYLADVAMVIVIDKSGSMSFADRGRQKIDLADEGAARVASLLKKSDQLGVLAVDSVPKWAFLLQKLGTGEAAEDAITSIRAGGGGIYVYSGLQEGYRRLKEAKASVKHVILFADTADCEEKEGPSGESSLLLAQRNLDQEKITTTTIGIGQMGDVDVDFLRQMATVGSGRFYFTNDMFTLPEIFTQESAIVQRYYINEEKFSPKAGEVEPLLTGIPNVPDLTGYVATTSKQTASVALWSHREDPILAFWRYGLGYSVAFTSDAGGLWSEPWSHWDRFEQFWTQISRYLAAENLPGNFTASTDQSGNITNIVVDALDESGEFLNSGSFSGLLLDGSGKSHPLQFQQTGPGRYEAQLKAEGNLFGKIFRIQGSEIAGETIVHFTGAKKREYEPASNGKKRLQQLGGKLVDSPDQLHFPGGKAVEIQDLKGPLLLFAAILFLIDVAGRKIDSSILRLRRSMPTVSRQETPPQWIRLKERKKTIAVTQDIARPMPTIQTELPEQIDESRPEEVAKPEFPESSDYIQRLKDAKQRRKT
jgi:Ca-activated chloride channel family protein